MEIFVYEHLTAGAALGQRNDEPPASLRREGAAMAGCVCADFAAIPGVGVVTLCGDTSVLPECPNVRVQRASGAAERHQWFEEYGRRCDWTLIVAPENDGILEQLSATSDRCRARRLGPSLSTIALAADKQATAEHLRRAGIPVPQGIVVGPSDIASLEETVRASSLDFPCVLKPRRGAGSQHVQLVRNLKDVAERPAAVGECRIEQYCPGRAASAACLCGPAGWLPLPPCRQRLGGTSGFEYLGGSLPLDLALDQRASRLVRRVIESLPGLLGYVGIDLVLGDAEDGRDDYVIEVNPRLTTSYVGLRAATHQNLAKAMLAVAMGEPCELQFSSDRVVFLADGSIEHGISLQQRRLR